MRIALINDAGETLVSSSIEDSVKLSGKEDKATGKDRVFVTFVASSLHPDGLAKVFSYGRDRIVFDAAQADPDKMQKKADGKLTQLYSGDFRTRQSSALSSTDRELKTLVYNRVQKSGDKKAKDSFKTTKLPDRESLDSWVKSHKKVVPGKVYEAMAHKAGIISALRQEDDDVEIEL